MITVAKEEQFDCECATFANYKNITKLWPYFRLCNIIKPVTPTSLVSPERKARKERNSLLGKLNYYNNQTKHK
jgi:hypothetical protein